MAALQTACDMAPFQTIEVTWDGRRAVAFPVDDEGRKEDVDFSYEATMLLIEGMKERFHELSNNTKGRPQIYREIHEELSQHGFNFSQERIRRKWNNLLGTYKRVKKESKRTAWEFYQVMSQFVPLDTTMPIVAGTTSLSRTTPPPPPPPPCSATSSSSSSSSTSITFPSPAVGKELEQGMKRQRLMEQYLEQLKQREAYELEYRKRKERRERMKVRALRQISTELQTITKSQAEILKQQNILLKALIASKS